jgi:hypothetical protein
LTTYYFFVYQCIAPRKMLAAPLKKSVGEDTNWVEPLQEFLNNNYGKEDAVRHNPSLQRLTTARTRMLTAVAPEEHMFDYLTSYLQMLVAVEPRFPVGEVSMHASPQGKYLNK